MNPAKLILVLFDHSYGSTNNKSDMTSIQVDYKIIITVNIYEYTTHALLRYRHTLALKAHPRGTGWHVSLIPIVKGFNGFASLSVCFYDVYSIEQYHLSHSVCLYDIYSVGESQVCQFWVFLWFIECRRLTCLPVWECVSLICIM